MSLLYTVIETNLIFHTEEQAISYAKDLLLIKGNHFSIDTFLSKPIYKAHGSFNGNLIDDEICDTISIEQLENAIAILEEKEQLDSNARKMIRTVEYL